MNIVEEISSLVGNLNTNQLDFWKYCNSCFLKIDPRKLSHNSRISLEDSRLIIFLEHSADKNTNLEFIVDSLEVYIMIEGIGKSTFMVFNKLDGQELLKATALFVESCVEGLYFKRKYFAANGNLIKEELLWENDKYPKTIFYNGVSKIFKFFT